MRALIITGLVFILVGTFGFVRSSFDPPAAPRAARVSPAPRNDPPRTRPVATRPMVAEKAVPEDAAEVMPQE
jgi:hypothetical protein